MSDVEKLIEELIRREPEEVYPEYVPTEEEMESMFEAYQFERDREWDAKEAA
jgi:hypothetical protein